MKGAIRVFGCVGLIASAAVATQAAAQPAGAEVRTRVDSVVVYPRSAMITRVANVSLQRGSNRFRVLGLPADVQVESLRVAVSGEGVRVGQVKRESLQTRDANDPAVVALQKRVEDAALAVAAIDDDTKAAQLKIKFLEGLAEGYAKDTWTQAASGNANATSWQQALGVLQNGAADAYATIRNNGARRKDADKELNVLKRELAQLQRGRLEESIVNVWVASDGARDAELRVRYPQGAAGWAPVYEARLNSSAGALQLGQKGAVWQQSDESWSNISLVLSTSEPSGTVAVPEPDSLFVGLEDPRVYSGVAAEPSMVEEMVVTAQEARAAGITDFEFRKASAPPPVRVGRFATSYDVPGRVDVANRRDQEQTFDLTTQSFDVDLISRVIPSRSSQAFLVARLDYDSDVPLGASRMNIFVDGVYAGAAQLPALMPGAENIRIPLGQDRRIEVRVADQGAAKGESG